MLASSGDDPSTIESLNATGSGVLPKETDGLLDRADAELLTDIPRMVECAIEGVAICVRRNLVDK
jgi:hypothetical protein